MTFSSSSHSLRRRLVGRLLAPLLVLLGVSGLLTFWLSFYFANNVYDGWLYDSANSLALLVDREGDHATCNLPVAAEEIFVWDETDSTFFTVRGEKSGVLASNADLPHVPAVADRYRDGVMFNSRMGKHKIHSISLELDRERAGERVWVQVAETDRKRQNLARTILLAVLIPQIALISAAFLAVNHGVKQGLRPLRQLTKLLGSKNPTSLQPLSNKDVPDEVLPLAQAINALLVGFHGVLDSQRKFIADTAHQLRTPLTAIKLNLDRALLEDGENSKETLRRLRRSADRATRLANQLLSLARVESGAHSPMHQEPVDLLRLAREVGAEWVPRALDKKIDLSLSPSSTEAWVRGDRTMLQEALDNLLDNAIKYHPGDGRISLQISVANFCRLTVEDDGPGIAPELWSKVFERFYRGDQSGDDGTGLGLPIVSEIAAAHGGRVWLEAALAGKGLRVVLDIPRAGAAAVA